MAQISSAPFRATLMLDDIAVDTWAILVDLSAIATYPHQNTNAIILKGLELQCEKIADGRYDVYVGVVLEADATNGTVTWIWRWNLDADGNATDGTDRFVDEKDWSAYGISPYQGLFLGVDNDVANTIVCSKIDAATTALQTDAGNLADAVGGTTSSAGAGDLVVFIDEGTTGGTISVNISAVYDTI